MIEKNVLLLYRKIKNYIEGIHGKRTTIYTTISESTETFRVYRARRADHFGAK
jgi:hypothetical protein